MAFTGTVLTTKGLALQNKVQAGATLSFTRVKIGDGTLASGASLEALRDLISPKMSLSISSIAVVGDGTSRIRSVVTNTGFAAGFFVREIGVFATDPDEGEIMYCVSNAGNECDYLPVPTSVTVEQTLDIITAIGNATSVTAVINETIVLATLKDISDHNALPNAHSLMMQFWQPEYNNYSVGDCIRPKIHGSYKFMECTVGGKSGTTEPTWGDVGSTVTDGGVTWVVRDRRQGTAIHNILKLIDIGGVAGLPAVDGSLLTGVVSSGTGWIKLLDGTMIQNGTTTTRTDGVADVNFPLTFNAGSYRIVGMHTGGSMATVYQLAAYRTASYCALFVAQPNGATSVGWYVDWVAIGRWKA